MPATRRRSLAPVPNPPPSLPSSTRQASKRVSTASFVAPAASKVSKKAPPAKPVRKNAGKKTTETPAENSFVAGDLFDFSGMEYSATRGPMTRSRRTSVYVAPGAGLITSTARKSVVKKPRTSNLDSVMETPKAEGSYVQPELSDEVLKTEENAIVESPPGEVSFKTETMTPQMIEQQARLLAKRDIIKNSSVVISPIKRPSKVLQPKQVAALKLPKKKASSNLPLPLLTPPTKIETVQNENLPAKVAALKSPKKKASTLPLPKLTVPKKIAAVQNENVPGTPQATEPGNLLKKHLKRKVDVRMDKKIDEIPKNSSPYALVMGETENGSPVENFVKISKPSKENVTGTPGPALKMRQNRVLQPLRNNTNNKIQENENGNTNPQRKSPRLLATPKHLNLSNKITATAVKISTKQAEIEPTITTPKLETENQAVNKTLAKQRLEITSAMRSNATANSGGQLVTGDLASLCTIM